MTDETKVKLYKWLFKGALAVAAAILIISVYLSAVLATSFYWALFAIPFAIAGLIIYFYYKRLAILAELRANWGRSNRHKHDMQEIASLYTYLQNNSFCLDDQTWSDLNMDSFFAKVDSTLSQPGESMLYNILRTPSFCPVELEARNKLIKKFQEDQIFREKLQIILHKLGRQRNAILSHLLWGKRPEKNRFAPLYTLAALAALCSLVLPFFIGPTSVFLIMGMFSLNSYIHVRVSKGFKFQIPTISYLGTLLRAAQRIGSLDVEGIEDYQASLAAASRASRKIAKRTKWLFHKAAIADFKFILDYLKMFFLLEVRSFYATIDEINRQIDHLQAAYTIIGTIDASQSVASYRHDLDYTEPEFKTTKMLTLKNVRHPLLDNPVANSIMIHDQGILITGSNMSGKSTFLRTVGINALLAQTIYTCLADTYSGCLTQVVTSINKADDIAEGKSFYFAEAERLRTIIMPEYKDYPALCLIDELLSGTNYSERLAASEAILTYLKTKNALVIVATHDLDLAEQLQDSYQCYHFTDKVDQSGLDFDFTLKQGVTTTRNAIKLLQYLGYPEQIIRQANKAVN